MKYVKQFDTLRAFAVLLVIIAHWISKDNILNILPNGLIGVDFFFVLSGFLITTILLNNRLKTNNINLLIKNFYLRRILRIFPIYYTTIIVLFIFDKYTGTRIKSDFIYYLTYTSNLNYFFIEKWDGILSHTWSLAVEEQYYLIWPWLIFILNKKSYLKTIIVFILIGILSQIILNEYYYKLIFTTSCFDSFGFGALFSWFLIFKKDQLCKLYKTIKYIVIIIIFFLFVGYFAFNKPYWFPLPSRTINSILSLFILLYVYLNRESNNIIFNYILNNKILIFIGKISYGIYLYHEIIPRLTQLFIINFLGKNHILYKIFIIPYFGTLINFMLLIFISWFSYVFFEKHFLKLKKYYVI